MQRIVPFSIDAASIKIFRQQLLYAINVMDTQKTDGAWLKLGEITAVHTYLSQFIPSAQHCQMGSLGTLDLLEMQPKEREIQVLNWEKSRAHR